MYADNQKKLAVIMNGKYPIPQLQNGAFHAVLGLTALVGTTAFELLNYDNDSLGIEAQISRFPNIVLSAKNGNQILKTYEEAKRLGLACNIFSGSMLGSSAEEQMQQTREATADTLNPMVVVLFGEQEDLQPLTKKFSLFKG